MSNQQSHVYFNQQLEKYKLIAAVKEPKLIEYAIRYKENLSAVILMTGNILTVKNYVQEFQKHGIPVILDVEKIGGLKTDYYGMNFIKKELKPFAIVTNKSGDIKRAKANHLFVIQRIFLVDSEVLDNLKDTIHQLKADMIELMPSRLPDITKEISDISPIPIITGGVLSDPIQAKLSLESGAVGVVTSNKKIWKMRFDDL